MNLTVNTFVAIILLIILEGSPSFIDESGQRGIVHSFTDGSQGGGVSYVDFDGDGWDDITLATGRDQLVHFYRNDNGQFSRIDLGIPHDEEAKQILWVDFDNDGDKDFFVCTRNGINRLYENNGELDFSDITAVSGLSMDSLNTYGACFGDYNRDGWLDLYVLERGGGQLPGQNGNSLYRNNGDGTFTDVTFETVTFDYYKIPFCSAFIDYNNDKWPDIYTANDKSSGNTLLKNLGNFGFFQDVSEQTGTGLKMNAMCVNPGDYNSDGLTDIYLTNTVQGNKLLMNNGADNFGEYQFTEVSDTTGTSFNGIGWGSLFMDADNDMDLDLYVSGMLSGSDTVSSAFYLNSGNGIFRQEQAGFSGDTVTSFSNAFGDADNNGTLDIIVSNLYFNSNLWVNKGQTENYLKITLEGKKSNRDGVGTLLELFSNNRYQRRYTTCGNSYLGQNSDIVHFGTGSATMVDSLIVTWLTGHIDKVYQVATNQNLELEEGFSTNGIINVDDDITLLTKTYDETEENKVFQLSLYPNPSGRFIYLDHDEISSGTKYRILNLSGQVILSGHAITNTINISTLSPGIYIVILDNPQYRTIHGKFIKV